ncbi:sulfurtransferase [Neptuniibacter caesariensis]|uniref:Rhodanese-like n=1 Tax=Neptuniibacter caesariensis TaxID=207954 RepID=A0A7U8C6J0_NEPCE|nr:sulfurtransferase [Neptuniibacter caesariensis]EAR62478.1 Rhodanese-like [Oceanospirillum sp. MED92] [Neptuniibacter caesariensis]
MFTTIISAKALQASITQPDWVILDCRFNLMDTAAGRTAYAEGHIPGAFYLHLDEDLSSGITPETGRHPLPDANELAEKLGRCGITQSTQVVVYDDCSGMMAGRCWWLLRYLGHDAVALLDGGLQAWQRAGGKLDQKLPIEANLSFPPSLQRDANLVVDQLQEERMGGSAILVDARAAERFRGEVEPIDPIAGHVPEALNRPLTDNLADGYFKAPEQLKSEWAALLGDQPAEQVVHMCGSGVTACHNQLSMEIAGLTGSRLYSGSWSEWIRDPKRPVAKGE